MSDELVRDLRRVSRLIGGATFNLSDLDTKDRLLAFADSLETALSSGDPSAPLAISADGTVVRMERYWTFPPEVVQVELWRFPGGVPMSDDTETIDVGPVHYRCRDDCPHPDHRGGQG